MHIAILHNADGDLLEDDPGREAREDVTRVASALAQALLAHGFKVEVIPVGESPLEALATLSRLPPDLVVNLCESLGADSRGEMALPCLLDLLGLPYTGSGALSLGLALHKDKAKEVLRARGVPTPVAVRVTKLEELAQVKLPFPLIVKPTREDASVGIEFDSVVHEPAALERAVERVVNGLAQPALVEQFIAGREIYVSLLGNRPRVHLPLSEIHFGPSFADRPNIVSYRGKWDVDSVEFQESLSGPCVLSADEEAKVVAAAQAAFEALECRDYGRVDLRLAPDGQPFVIDVNPNCDLHPEAGFAKTAKSAGIEYPALALRLVEIALERHHANPPTRRPRPRPARRAAEKNRKLYPGRGELRTRAH